MSHVVDPIKPHSPLLPRNAPSLSSAIPPYENQAKEMQFDLHGFTYAAQLWGEDGQLPVIALHGLLDNSASFDVIAPLLDNVQCLALDLAGHGFSDHKLGLADYPLWSEVSAIYTIADQMGWQEFAIMGHSRGAMMSLVLSGVYPKRISHMILLDSVMPPVIPPADAVNRMVQSYEEIQQRVNRKMSLYESYDDAIMARCLSRYARVTRTTAQLLATRGLREVGGQFHWHADGKLWAASSVALSHEMLSRFVDNIAQESIDSLVVLGQQGLVSLESSDKRFSRLSYDVIHQLSSQVHYVDDGHFLHMEDNAATVAALVNDFLSQ